MITHEIVRYEHKPPVMLSQLPKDQKPKVVVGSPEHYQRIMEGTVSFAKAGFAKGESVCIANGSAQNTGLVMDVFEDETDGGYFAGYQFRCIEVYWYHNGKIDVYNPGQLVNLEK